MPRTTKQIMAHADELARRFEDYEPGDDGRDARSLRDVASAFEQRARAERDLHAAVTVARAEGHSWAAIGAMLGTSGEAARQRYGSTGSSSIRAGRVASRSRSGEIREWAVREGHAVTDQERKRA
jgi:hypothetical protein